MARPGSRMVRRLVGEGFAERQTARAERRRERRRMQIAERPAERRRVTLPRLELDPGDRAGAARRAWLEGARARLMGLAVGAEFFRSEDCRAGWEETSRLLERAAAAVREAVCNG